MNEDDDLIRLQDGRDTEPPYDPDDFLPDPDDGDWDDDETEPE